MDYDQFDYKWGRPNKQIFLENKSEWRLMQSVDNRN